MNIERYLVAYEKYRDDIISIKRAMSRRESAYRAGFASAEEMREFWDEDEMAREYERKKRILAHATKRLQKAIGEIKDSRFSEYLVCRYLYRMRMSDIADSFHFCERHMYRLSSQAKKQLKKHLIRLFPRAKRSPKPQRYTFKRKPKHFHRKHGPWAV